MIDLLIVDDEPLIRSGLVGALSQFPYLRVVGEATTATPASTLSGTTRPMSSSWM